MKITNWYTGVVENTNDPLQLGRVQVRCMGYHTPDLTLIPSKDLPWATVILPTTSAGLSGVGSSVGLMSGSWVFGFFRDLEMQDPVVLGTMSGSSSISGYDNNRGTTPILGFQDPMGTYPLTAGHDIPAGALSYAGKGNPAYNNKLQASMSISSVFMGKGNTMNATGVTGPNGVSAPTASGSAAAIVPIAQGQIGVIETNNNNIGPGIEKYWTAVGGGYGQSWCAAFVCWCVQQSGILDDKNRPKTASAFGLETEWAASHPSIVQIIRNPREAQPGDIVIFSWASGKGHAGIVKEPTPNGFTTIEGNTVSNGVEGVFMKNKTLACVRSLLRIKSGSSNSTSTVGGIAAAAGF